MKRKWLTTASVLFALAVFAGSAFVQSSSAAPGEVLAAPKPAGLTQHGIARAHESGAPSRLVAMQPQSSVALIKQQATRLGAHAPNSSLTLTVGLKLRNVAKLKTFLEQVQNPASPVYHQFLTPEQFTAEYGPSTADVASVTRFLKQHGIKVEGVSKDRLLIHTEASTKVYEHAFGIGINNYSLNDRHFYSTTDRPKLPRTIAPLVTNILGLNHAVVMQPLHHVVSLGLSTAEATSYAPPPATSIYYNPHQIATAYDWPSITDPNNGAGVTIAILTAAASGLASNTMYGIYWNAFGLPDHDVKIIPVHGDVGDTRGLTESLLDVELSGAMAPGAALDVYVSSNLFLASFSDMYDRFVTDNDAQVMTVSWGSNEDLVPALYKSDEQIFMKAAAQGISMFAATGDKGSGSGSGQANMANYPSSSVYITSANGTELHAKKDGSYISETAWSGTGGAISQLFDQPDWQTGPGVPDSGWRMNSDMAMNASPAYPYLIAVGGLWKGVGGTSAVSPQLAALFAVADSHQDGNKRLGQSNKLIYNEVNAGYYDTGFRDITSGCNGAYCAKTDWDHPTGWGSPRAKNLIEHLGVHGPAGTLKGTISDAASGAPIAGATVGLTPGARQKKTLSDGSYSFLLPVGNYNVAVSAFGYEDGTASVSVSKDTTTTQNVALEAAPSATLSGRVTDGSGHGYGLYAEIKVSTADFGEVADVWTDPATGDYSVSLPKGNQYKLKVSAALDGYRPDSATVALSADKTQNFALKVTSVCTAPGYAFKHSGFSEDFNGGFPPTGWSVTNAVNGSPVVWKSNQAWGDDNWTGGTGNAADSDSGKVGPGYQGPHDTSLVSPSIAVTGLAANPVLRYKANFQSFQGKDALNLGISTDGGATWRKILHWDSDHGGKEALPGENVKVELGPYLPASGSFRLRWRNYDTDGNGWDYYAQIDDVSIGACAPLSGGLIYGQVTDANTGDGIVGAHVKDDRGEGTNTVESSADPNLPVGAYLFFAASGERSLTASAHGYTPATDAVDVSDNAVVTQNFTLNSGRFAATPAALSLNVPVNGQSQETITVKNIGSGSAHFLLLQIPMAPPGASAAAADVAPVEIEGHFTLANMPYARAHERSSSSAQPAASAVPYAPAWTGIASYPTTIQDDAVARDPATGKIYSVGGFNGATDTNAGFVYDPAVGGWAFMPYMAVGRGAPVAAFINGKLYVANGWSASNGDPVARLGIYDPDKNKWTQGAANPIPAGGGSAVAVLNGKVYVVGGCKGGSCLNQLAAVQVYNPVANSWSSAADYPHPVVFAACGSIDGRLYCAGGASGSTVLKSYADGYAYDPGNDSWTPIADMPFSLYASGYAAANGQLLMSGGIANNAALTTRGIAYDPFSNKWRRVPNASYAVYRSGSACGLYRIGGTNGTAPVSSSELLPGYAPCNKPPFIPWLTVTPPSSTLDAGASTTLKLTFDGTGQKPFTTSKAYVEIASYTPYDAVIVPLTVNWDPEHVSLALTGSAGQKTIPKGGSVLYKLMVENQQGEDYGPATKTTLTYDLPSGVDYVASNGDATCTAPSAASSQAPAASSGSPGVVSCDFGKLTPGESKGVTIVIQANVAGKLTSTFKVSAREPDDSGSSTLSLVTTVGSSDNGGGNGGGGGALGWLALAALLGLAFAGAYVRARRG